MGCESSTWTEYCTSGRPPVEFARDLGPAVGVGAAARHSRPVAPGSHQIAPVVSMETSGTTVHTARPFISTPLTVCITPRLSRGPRGAPLAPFRKRRDARIRRLQPVVMRRTHLSAISKVPSPRLPSVQPTDTWYLPTLL